MKIRKNSLGILLGSTMLFAQIVTAAPSQNCSNNIRASAPSQRFIDHKNGTITDLQHNLMWKQCLEGQTGRNCYGEPLQMNWRTANHLTHPNNIHRPNFANHNDWRLPTIDELASIVERRCNNPASNLEIFPRTHPAGLWSSNQSGGNAWSIDFNRGQVFQVFKAGGKYVRLVRNLR